MNPGHYVECWFGSFSREGPRRYRRQAPHVEVAVLPHNRRVKRDRFAAEGSCDQDRTFVG